LSISYPRRAGVTERPGGPPLGDPETGSVDARRRDCQHEVRDKVEVFESDACCDVSTHRLPDKHTRAIDLAGDEVDEVVGHLRSALEVLDVKRCVGAKMAG
jgi:hypothetical protein